jgi:6-hydroxymethylpterin diphosphokinase MptE-like
MSLTPQAAARLALHPDRSPIEHRPLESVPEVDVLFVEGAALARSAYEQFSGELVIFEEDLGAIGTLLDELWIGDPRVSIHAVERGDPIDHLVRKYRGRRSGVVSLGPATELKEAIYWARLDDPERERQVFQENFAANLRQLPRAGHWRHLVGKYSGVPAIICGAGPSLDNVLDKLHGGLIIAAGSALTGLRHVRPHLAVGVDPNPPQLHRMLAHHAFEVPLLFRPRMHHEAVALHHGPLLYLSGENGHPIARYAEQKLNLEGPEMVHGYNVVHLAVEVARNLGCSPIILTGLDLAFTDGAPYASGVDDAGVDEPRILTTDIHGNPIETLQKWITEADWLSRYSHPLYNATGAGLPIAGVPTFDLASLPPLDLDLTEEVLGAPQAASQEEVETFLREMAESLERMKQYGDDPLSQFEREEEIANQTEALEAYFGA